MAPPRDPMTTLLNAASFAARAHQGQLRKDGATPYVSHPFRVCLTVRQRFGVDDEGVLAAALLHDTIEDTATDFDDVSKAIGPEAAGWVRALTKDMREPESVREKKYIEELAASPWQVKVCKLADLHDNLLDSEGFTPEKRARTLRRSREYLDVLDDADEKTHRAFGIVQRLIDEIDPRTL